MLLEDPTDTQLAALGVSSLPTWLRWEPVDGTVRDHAEDPPGGGADGRGIRRADILGCDSEGDPVQLAGAWELADRIEGARPKHEVHERFGPDSTRPVGPRPVDARAPGTHPVGTHDGESAPEGTPPAQ